MTSDERYQPPTDAELDWARCVGDAPADKLVEELGPRCDWIELLATVGQNDDPLPSHLPAALRTFLEEETGLPCWAHSELLRTAQWWADDHLHAIVTALFCATLPSAYAAQNGAFVAKSSRRSASELARFVFDVIETGSLGSEGRAIRACQKMRLTHALARRQLRRSTHAAGQVPINQEDMLAALLGFSVLTLEAAKKLQTSSSRNGEEAYYQLWRAMSGLLGISERLVPPTLAEAIVLADRIAARRVSASTHGRQLTTTLMTVLKKCLAPWSIEEVPEQLVSELCHPRVRRALGLRAPRVHTDPLRDTILDQSGPPSRSVTRNVSRLVGRALFDAWISPDAVESAPRLQPPTRERWGLTA